MRKQLPCIFMSLAIIMQCISCVKKQLSVNAGREQIIFLQYDSESGIICSVDTNGQNKKELFRGFKGRELGKLTVSPNGEWLAFQEGNNPGLDFYRDFILGAIQLINNKIIRIDDFTQYIYQPYSWSSAGTKIAYVSVAEKTPGLYMYNFDKNTKRKLSDEIFDIVTWSPDDTKIAMFANWPDSMPLTIISTTATANAEKFAIKNLSYMKWFTMDTLIFLESCKSYMQISKFDINTGKKEVIFHDRSLYIFTLMLAPNRKMLAFTGVIQGDTLDFFNIYIIGTDGQNLKKISNMDADGLPSWSPDGQRIVFVSEKKGQEGIYVVNTDGSNLRRVVDFKDGKCSYPIWVGKH